MASDSRNDERIAKRTSSGDVRADRLSMDRQITENREVSDSIRLQERRAMLRDSNTLLPAPPPIDGYHLVWLTTSNARDPLEGRFRRGYELVKPTELPDFKFSTQKSGESLSEDRIQINEMVLAKIALDLWREDMKYLHYDLPKESISALKDSVKIGRDGRGRDVAYTGGEFQGGVADGYAQTRLSTPDFSKIA